MLHVLKWVTVQILARYAPGTHLSKVPRCKYMRPKNLHDLTHLTLVPHFLSLPLPSPMPSWYFPPCRLCSCCPRILEASSLPDCQVCSGTPSSGCHQCSLHPTCHNWLPVASSLHRPLLITPVAIPCLLRPSECGHSENKKCVWTALRKSSLTQAKAGERPWLKKDK